MDIEEGLSSSSSTEMSDVPENCICMILCRTSVRDVCRSSIVSRQFLAAATSDAVWKCFLPSAHQVDSILAAASVPVEYSSMKQLYFQLCDSILVHNSTEVDPFLFLFSSFPSESSAVIICSFCSNACKFQRIWIERSTAKIGYMLSASALFIVWGSDDRYWRWQPREDSSFGMAAVLKKVTWLEIQGRLDCRMLSPHTRYRVSFVVKCTEQFRGWSAMPVKLWLRLPDGQLLERERMLQQPRRYADPDAVDAERSICGAIEGHHGWLHLVAGEFTAKPHWHSELLLVEDSAPANSKKPVLVEFGMCEWESGRWKHGLILDGVRIEPLELGDAEAVASSQSLPAIP